MEGGKSMSLTLETISKFMRDLEKQAHAPKEFIAYPGPANHDPFELAIKKAALAASVEELSCFSIAEKEGLERLIYSEDLEALELASGIINTRVFETTENGSNIQTGESHLSEP